MAAWSWTSQLPESWDSKFCCVSWSMVFSYSSLRWLRQMTWLFSVICRLLHSTCVLKLSCDWLFVTPWAVAPQATGYQAPLSMGFSRQEYWSGLPFPILGDLPDPGIKPMSLASPALTGRFFTPSATWEAPLREWPQLKKEADMKGLSASCTSHIWAFSWEEIWAAQLHFTSCVTELLLFLVGSSWFRISLNHLHWRKT